MILLFALFVSALGHVGGGGAGNGKLKHQIWVMALKGDANPETVALHLGLQVVHRLPISGQRVYAFRERLERRVNPLRVAQLASASPLVDWHERQIPRQQTKRATALSNNGKRIITDPLYTQQWHLQPSTLSGIHLHAQEGWAVASSNNGNASVIAIVDDGLQHTHPDLHQNYQSSLSHDFNDEDANPMPERGDGHGTSAAGVAAAGANNNVCGVGVCPDCKLAGLRLIGGPSSDYMEAMALSHQSDQIAIYSNSWGPADDGRTMEGPGRVTLLAMEQSITRGRNGKGTIYVWAGGNGGASNDNGNYDGYANSRFTIAVGAIAHDGKRSYYSEPCACLMVTAPSSGQRGFGIVTTDLMGYDGYSTNDCTSDFGGTSSAAPAVAGAIGVLLSKRPHLTRRQVLWLLATTSDQPLTTTVGYGSGDWTPRNARGVSHSHEYGWGLVNIGRLVSSPDPLFGRDGQEKRATSNRITPYASVSLGDGSASPFTHDFNVSSLIQQQQHLEVVEYVEVRIWLTHPRRGDMAISLRDDKGVTSILAAPHEDNHAGYNQATGWTFGSARHWGQDAKGTWTLSVADGVRNGRTGSLLGFELVIYGQ